jgi:hypothetical protein
VDDNDRINNNNNNNNNNNMMMMITLCYMFTGAFTVSVLGFRPSHQLMHEVGSVGFYL